MDKEKQILFVFQTDAHSLFAGVGIIHLLARQNTRAGEWEVTQSRVARNRGAPQIPGSSSPDTDRP